MPIDCTLLQPVDLRICCLLVYRLADIDLLTHPIGDYRLASEPPSFPDVDNCYLAFSNCDRGDGWAYGIRYPHSTSPSGRDMPSDILLPATSLSEGSLVRTDSCFVSDSLKCIPRSD